MAGTNGTDGFAQDAPGSPVWPSIRHPRKRAMLAALARTGNVSASSRAANVPRRTHYEWTANDPEYAVAVDEAMEEAIEVLEAVARRRAVVGSDTLLIFLLKAARPDVYRDRYHIEHAGAVQQRVLVENMRESIHRLLTQHPEVVKTLEDQYLGMSLPAPKET